MQLETRKEKEKRVKKNRRHTRIGLLSIAGFVCVFLIIFLIAKLLKNIHKEGKKTTEK